jgi:hexokinase
MLNPHPDILTTDQMEIITESFLEELQNISSKNPSPKNSLSYIKNPFPPKNLIGENEIFQVIVIGGSIMKIASVETLPDTFQILDIETINLPPLADKNIFFELLMEYINPMSKLVCLNIAFPGEAFVRDNRLDYKITKGTKGHNLDGVIGKNIGEELEKRVEEQFGEKIMITCAHDITCLLMSYHNYLGQGNVMGGVIGTGVNFGFVSKDKKCIINLESGNFNKFHQTSTGRQVDKESLHKGTQLFEKEVSSKYLCQHFNDYLKRYDISLPPTENGEDISMYARLNNESDESEIAQILLTRSARFAACQIAGVYRFLEYEKLICVTEGSLAWKGWNYMKNLTEALEELGISQTDLIFHKIDKSSILGCAYLSQKIITK